ncbi:MAG: tRNA pseudouridine(38-40) synthase TruA [Bacteroidales bacterium]
MNRYFIHLAYNGSLFHGWQIQPNAISVQEEIQICLKRLLREDLSLTGCGRTDTGVHANDFYAHFETDNFYSEEELKQLCYKMNRYFKVPIYINEIFSVDTRTHARFDAESRTYKYIISKNRSPFFTDLLYHNPAILDINLMNKGCEILFNYKDFTSFSKLHTQTKTNNCKIIEAYWEEKEELLIFHIKADRFLRNMVRAITGTMLELGQGKISIHDFEEIILAKDRSKAGFSVPGNALYLYKVEYPKELMSKQKKGSPAYSLNFL